MATVQEGRSEAGRQAWRTIRAREERERIERWRERHRYLISRLSPHERELRDARNRRRRERRAFERQWLSEHPEAIEGDHPAVEEPRVWRTIGDLQPLNQSEPVQAPTVYEPCVRLPRRIIR